MRLYPWQLAPIAPWSKSWAPYYQQTLESVASHFGFSMETPWNKLKKKEQEIILFGTDETITFTYKDDVRSYQAKKPFEGVINSLARRLIETDSDNVREELSNYQAAVPCDSCDGYRLKQEALAVKIADKHIGEITDLSIEKAKDWFSSLSEKLTKKEQEIASRILKEINERLYFLNNVGLDYLTLSRTSGTLSGGESQRIRLASQIGSGLTGVLYVLDEPSIGLHQRDNDRPIADTRKAQEFRQYCDCCGT